MTFTYQDFEKKAKESGLINQFSEANLRLAQNNPDAGMSLLQYKIDYGNATTAEGRAVANAGAEGIRKQYGGYTGGKDGSGFKLSDNLPTPVSFAPSSAKPQHSYDALEDPTYKIYEDVFRREGKRAAEDTMGRAAQQTGGMASSYAVTAAAAQEQEAAKKIADIIPQLEAQAYDRHQKEVAQWNAERNFDYSKLLDQIGFMQNEKTQAQNLVNIKLELGQPVTDAELTKAGYDRIYADGYAAEKTKADAKAKVDWWINIGIIPDDGLLTEAGYGAEEIAKLKASQQQSGAVEQKTLYEQLYATGLNTEEGITSWILANGYTDSLSVAEAIAEGYINEVMPGMRTGTKQPEAEEISTYRGMLDVVKNYSASQIQAEIDFAKTNGYAQWYIDELEKLLNVALKSEEAALTGGSV